jgi:hypothetical protein
MTNDERFIIKLNIAHYQAMLKLDIDAEKRSIVARFARRSRGGIGDGF